MMRKKYSKLLFALLVLANTNQIHADYFDVSIYEDFYKREFFVWKPTHILTPQASETNEIAEVEITKRMPVSQEKSRSRIESEAYQVVLDPLHKTELFAEIKTPVTKITKKMGDSFEAGEILIQMEEAVLNGNYYKAIAYRDKASSDLEAIQDLYSHKLASLFDLKEAEANLAAAVSDWIQAKKNLSSCSIIAPYSGVVVSIFAEEYELPQTGKSLIKIIDDNILIAKLLVNSSLLSRIKIGQPITIEISETNKTIETKVTRIGGMIDPSSSTIKIEADIDNSSKELKAGMTGIARFIL